MKLLVMGGSYNPVHIGHLILAEEALDLAGYDRVVFVPAHTPPHKTPVGDPGPEARLRMLRAACEGEPAFAVDDCELRRGGVSYTLDTLRDLKTRWDIDGLPGLLLGDDLIPGFPSWREPEAIARECDLVCAHRHSPERLPFPYPHSYIDNLLVPVSSTLVRERVAEGRGFRRLVPDSVWTLIREGGYYRA